MVSTENWEDHNNYVDLSTGIDGKIRFVFIMSPLMTKVAAESDFIQCNITYNECKDNPYIFNAVAFNSIVME